MRKIFTIAILTFAFGLVAYGLIPGKTVITGDVVKFTGMYGIELNLSDIEQVQLINKIPKIKSRTNGLSAFGVKKGHFNLEGYGKSRLLVESSQPPFLLITTKSQETVISNSKNPEDTKAVFEKIKEGL
ncbi:PH domain-containing protein [Algoriphagus sp. AK58]|uniref:PH domain-containing protein n=1 Tax=Algoriphagus sp. AK58 TaxID=1406877 RepID=UPI0016507B59|nr:PH domain-containing protein [Algoriphagus sp. AK58]